MKPSTKNRPNAQGKYRKAQTKKGLVRFELQVSIDSKMRFEDMVNAKALDYPTPWDRRRRLAKARAEIFKELTHAHSPTFVALTNRIRSLEEEINVISPTYFDRKIETHPTVPIPHAINALPDDPKHLKTLLTTVYQDAQQATRQAQEYHRQATQYRRLYETVNEYNEELKQQLNLEPAELN